MLFPSKVTLLTDAAMFGVSIPFSEEQKVATHCGRYGWGGASLWVRLPGPLGRNRERSRQRQNAGCTQSEEDADEPR